MMKILYKHNKKLEECEIDLLEQEDSSVLVRLSATKDSIFIEKKGENYFHVFQEIRQELESKNIELLCNGASLNVYPSPMQLDMGGGDLAYRIKIGFHTQMTDIVDIFRYDEDCYIKGTVSQQIEYYNRWVISKKKLKLDQQVYDTSSIELNAEFVFFWGHKESKNGMLNKSCLSQWWPSAFIKDGVRYSTAEQWMMAEKARLFSDINSLEKIIKTTDPKEVKALGRKISFFDEEIWKLRRYDIVKEGSYLKFNQNSELKDYLLNTGKAILVEASPYDKIWGIGMTQDDQGVENPNNWRGENLLGFALMDVRDELRHNNHSQNEIDWLD